MSGRVHGGVRGIHIFVPTTIVHGFHLVLREVVAGHHGSVHHERRVSIRRVYTCSVNNYSIIIVWACLYYVENSL